MTEAEYVYSKIVADLVVEAVKNGSNAAEAMDNAVYVASRAMERHSTHYTVMLERLNTKRR